MAWIWVLGMVLVGFVVTVRESFLEGLTILFLARVCIGCIFAMGGCAGWCGLSGTGVGSFVV